MVNFEINDVLNEFLSSGSKEIENVMSYKIDEEVTDKICHMWINYHAQVEEQIELLCAQ